MEDVTWPVGHAHRIYLVATEAHPAKYACEGVERYLKLGALWRRDKSVIGVEKRR